MAAILLALVAPRAFATPYEVLYDANTDGVFPEDVGWERWTTGGGVSRTVQDGIFTLTAVNPAPNGGSDQYRWDGMEMLNPGLGEMFYAEWRMRLGPGSGSTDVGVFIFPDGMERAFHLQYAVNGVGSAWDSRVAFLDTTVFRTFRLESLDMIDYNFYIDGAFAWQGFFGLGTTRSSEVMWGDGLVGSASSSQWDYFKFGVITVPEPHSAFLLITGCLIALRWGRRALAPSTQETCHVPDHRNSSHRAHAVVRICGNPFPQRVGWVERRATHLLARSAQSARTKRPRATEIARALNGTEPIVSDLRHPASPARVGAQSRLHPFVPQFTRRGGCLRASVPSSNIPHRPLGRLCVFALALALTAQIAFGTPYEVLYDANTDGVFPEDVGWQRHITQGGAARTVENGIFTLMAQNPSPNGGSDQYIWDAMEMLNPGPGEMFYAEWRVRVLPGSDGSDVHVFIATDGMQRAFDLLYTVAAMRSVRDGRRLDLDTTQFHTYRIESFDMVDYTMFVDGGHAWDGFFGSPTTQSSRVRFGDGLFASASGSAWDYFRFGAVQIPEPSALYLVVSGYLVVLRRRADTASLRAIGIFRRWRLAASVGFVVIAMTTVFAPRTYAAPYKIEYDANSPGVFPEDEGWVRLTTGGGANRTVEGGILTLMAQNPSPNGGSDQYRWNAMETLNPDPGEMFYAEWRLRLTPESDNSDVGVAIFADGMLRDVAILYTVFSVRNTGDGRRLDLDTTIFHTYRLESADMIDYTMFVDGQPVWTGFFAPGSTQSSFVRFGDGLVAASSGSEWDYFRFGVVPIPEPSSIFLVSSGCLCVLRRRAGTQAFYTEDRSCPGSSRLWRCYWPRPPDPHQGSSSSN